MLLRFFAVQEEDLLMVLQRMMNSRLVADPLDLKNDALENPILTNNFDRNPKVDYYVGLHPFICNVLNALPSPFCL